MDILPSCALCGNPFTPLNSRQKYCRDCIHKPCPQCGAKKDVRAELCRSCVVPEANFTRILPMMPCPACNVAFTPRNMQQLYCSTCSHKGRHFRKPCESCGARKRSTGPYCRKCDTANRLKNPRKRKPTEAKSIEQVILEAEALGLLPEKQYAFGYVIGVVFGDGCAYPVTSHIPHVCSDGTTRYHDSTTYLIKLSVTSEAFANRFAKQWEILVGRHIKVSTSIRTNFSKSTLKGRQEQYSVQLFNVNPGHTLLGRYFAHLKYESEPSVLLGWPVETTQGFIDGMVDSEGYVCDAYTDIANKNIALLNMLAIMLQRLGYPAKIYTSPSQNVAHLRTASYRVKYEGFD